MGVGMTDATQLREALTVYDNRFEPQLSSAWEMALPRLAEAARTIALPILEQDEGLVERIASALFREHYGQNPSTDWYRFRYLAQAKAVLAALIPEKSLMGSGLPPKERGVIALEDLDKDSE